MGAHTYLPGQWDLECTISTLLVIFADESLSTACLLKAFNNYATPPTAHPSKFTDLLNSAFPQELLSKHVPQRSRAANLKAV